MGGRLSTQGGGRRGYVLPKIIKYTMSNRGGKRKGAGRKKDPVRKKRITMNVPIKYESEIKEKFSKINEAYVEKCKKEL